MGKIDCLIADHIGLGSTPNIRDPNPKIGGTSKANMTSHQTNIILDDLGLKFFHI